LGDGSAKNRKGSPAVHRQSLSHRAFVGTDPEMEPSPTIASVEPSPMADRESALVGRPRGGEAPPPLVGGQHAAPPGGGEQQLLVNGDGRAGRPTAAAARGSTLLAQDNAYHYRSPAAAEDRSVSPVCTCNVSPSRRAAAAAAVRSEVANQRVAEHSPMSRSVSPLDCLSPARRGQASPDVASECCSPHQQHTPVDRRTTPRSGSSSPSKRAAARKKISSIREPEPEYFPALVLHSGSHRWPEKKLAASSPSIVAASKFEGQVVANRGLAQYSGTSDDEGSSVAHSSLGFDDCQGPFRCLLGATGKAISKRRCPSAN